MSVTADDVRHMAALARLGLDADRVVRTVGELNSILAHMEALQGVDTSSLLDEDGGDRGRMPLRSDDISPTPLALTREEMAPEMRDGFFLVPRLATHDAEEGA